MNCFSKIAVACLLPLIFCGCHKDQDGAPVVSIELASCAGGLEQIASAKEAWAKETGASSNSISSWDDLKPHFPHGPPRCSKHGTYTIGAANELPKCTIASHNEYFLSQQEQDQKR